MNKRQQFVEAYENYSEQLLRYCYFKIRDQETAKDMLLQTFAKVWEYMGRHEDIINLRAFLYKTLSNLIIDEYRKRKSDISLEALEEEDGYEPSFDDTESWFERFDGGQALELLKTMPHVYSDVLLMRYVKGFSLGEIAEATGKNQNAIAVRIHRGMAKLKKLFFLRYDLGWSEMV